MNKFNNRVQMCMRQFLFIFMVISTVCSKGQINVIEGVSKPLSKPYIVTYDSLTNIKETRDDSIKPHQSFKHLIGQTIYYVSPDTTKSRVYHKAYYSTPEIKYGTLSLPRNTCMDRYWKITNIVVQKSSYGGSDKEIFELTDTTDGKRVYCESRNMNRDFIVLGYYEKIKEKYVGKTYIYQHTFYSDVWDNDRYNYLINFQTKNTIRTSQKIRSGNVLTLLLTILRIRNLFLMIMKADALSS